MQEMTMSESRARLGYLMSEMLSLPSLPPDIHTAITTHLKQQWTLVNVLKPEYCLRLYPVLIELAELENNVGTQVLAEASTVETPVETEVTVEAETTVETEAPVEAETTVETEAPVEAETTVETEAPVEAEATVVAEATVETETAVEVEDSSEEGSIALAAGAASGRTLW